MKLISYKAKCGDAFHIQYVGRSGCRRNILLDMGYSKTYTDVLKRIISDIADSGEKIDTLFLSHIHNDHIGGASKFIRDIESGTVPCNIVAHWIYNAPGEYKTVPPSENKNGTLCSIVSGDSIYEHILRTCPLEIDEYIAGRSFDLDGMRISLLSPNTHELKQLRDKYANNRPYCIYETDEASIEAGAVYDDYLTPLADFKTDIFQEDTSIENASSIAAVFEFEGKRILWLADSVPSVVIRSLSEMGFSDSNKLHCDIVILSHHGSSANNSLDLFRMISAEKFVISADGINRHCLPNKETIARIISASSILPVNLHFNYDDGRIKHIFDIDEVGSLNSLVTAHYLRDMEAIEI